MTSDRIQEIRQRLEAYDAAWKAQDVFEVARISRVGYGFDVRDLLAALSTAEAQLAECYRLSGADPDGNEDWRLAPYAVNAVKNLRANLDEADQEAEKLREKLATAEAEGRRQAELEIRGQCSAELPPDRCFGAVRCRLVRGHSGHHNGHSDDGARSSSWS